MSTDVFPELPGVTWSVKKTPRFKTLVKEAISGREYRASVMAYPIWEIDVSFEFLRAGAFAELETLLGFFLLRKGAFESFYFDDLSDNSVSNQLFGAGDGTTTAFQLVRGYGAAGFVFVEPVVALNGSPAIKKAGVLQSTGYSVSATGLVTFTVPPAVGAQLTWSGGYYYNVRFKEDVQDFNQFMRRLWEAKKVSLVSVKV